MRDLPLFSALALQEERLGEIEEIAHKSGIFPLVGVDEAGRGPWAGPVVAAAVIFPAGPLPLALDALNDSKKLNERVRQSLIQPIYEHALGVGIGRVDASRIDEINILQATFEAMRGAVNIALKELKLSLKSAGTPTLLVDGRQKIPHLTYPQRALIKGDARSLHIAAASIIAKTDRDELMCAFDDRYPGYHFSKHKGYGTKAHQRALQALGPCPIHRFSYRPIREAQETMNTSRQ
jgi:ribonuclease HII